MKRVDKYATHVVFDGEEPGESVSVSYDNRGEPYREGATFTFKDDGEFVSVFLEKRELKELHKVLGGLV